MNPEPGDENTQRGDGQFEAVFETNPLAMYIASGDTLEFLEVNAAAVLQYGYSREEFLGMKITDIRPPAEVPKLLEQVRRNKTSFAKLGHWRHRRKNGEVFEVDVTTKGIRFAGQDAVLVVTQDISERRAAEQKMAEQAAFSSALTENSPLAIIALDRNRRVQTCNSAFERLFGYPLGEIRGKELETLIAPGDNQEEMLGFVGRVMTGEIVRAISRRRRRDGSLVDVRIIGVPLIVDGEQTGTFGIYEDITERGRAEEAQHRAEEKYRRLFDGAVEGFFESTPEGRFVTVNPAMARIAGYSSAAEMVGQIHDIGKQLYVDPVTRAELQKGLEDRGFWRVLNVPCCARTAASSGFR
jgi:PAS domain S-box-containing protein